MFICTQWREDHHRGKAARSAWSLDPNGFTCASAWRADMLGVATVPHIATQWIIGLPTETIRW